MITQKEYENKELINPVTQRNNITRKLRKMDCEKNKETIEEIVKILDKK
jgi:hypothetical protein